MTNRTGKKTLIPICPLLVRGVKTRLWRQPIGPSFENEGVQVWCYKMAAAALVKKNSWAARVFPRILLQDLSFCCYLKQVSLGIS